MSSPASPRPPRPVADAPVGDVPARAQELVRAWAAALIATQPLERSATMPLDALCREAPALCAHVLRALASDAELDELHAGGKGAALAARIGELSGARDLPSALAAAESLRGVSWRELHRALEQPSTQQVAELADRLAYIFSLIATALATGGESRAAHEPTRVEEPPAGDPHRRGPQIEIHDARREGPGAWIRSIGDCLSQHAARGLPFAVLLIEVIGIERLRHAEDQVKLGRLVGDVQDALRGELRAADTLTRESEGRYWLLAPQLDRGEAMSLAERLIGRVRHTVIHRGAPVEVAVGIAMCPEDGREAAELAASADTRLFAARAAGVSLAPQGESIGGPDPPA